MYTLPATTPAPWVNTTSSAKERRINNSIQRSLHSNPIVSAINRPLPNNCWQAARNQSKTTAKSICVQTDIHTRMQTQHH